MPNKKINKNISIWVVLGSSVLTVVTLAMLHILSPEFDPAWRMVSEYADGSYGWLLSLMFLFWAVSSWVLAYALRPYVTNKSGKIGLIFLVLAGVGEAMAAVFDVNHELHNVAGNVGIASLPVAALLIGRTVKSIKLLKHATWISVILLIISFIILMSTYVSSGGDINSEAEITELPNGVIAVVGYANRLLVIVYVAWAAATAWSLGSLNK